MNLIVLDTGPVGMISNPNGKAANFQCLQWAQSLLASGHRVVIPEIADYEVRRELLRLDKARGLARLDVLKGVFYYAPLTTDVMILAAKLWADARRRGLPTADPQALDGDAILAAQALMAGGPGDTVIVATGNVGHLRQFVDARIWDQIVPRNKNRTRLDSIPPHPLFASSYQPMLTRRQWLAQSTALMLAPGLVRGDGPRKKVAFIGTEVRTHSHAQHFLDRMTLGYNWAGQWVAPRVDIASIYIDQTPEGDLSKGRIARYGLKQFPTVEEALTLGGSDLAVDGVVIIAEHGKYPKNEKGQTLYPRYEFFKAAVKVFERSGRSVPIFNDKHLSTTWSQCREMVDDSKRLGFPFLAGSSLPVTWRLPQVDMPIDTPLVESVCVGYGGVDSYDFHGLETAQCMSERRLGGETGIRRVQALRGPALWQALAADDREPTRKLMVAALNRSHNLPVVTGYPTDAVTYEWAKKTFPDMLAYFIDHVGGFRTTLFLAAIRDFNYAGLSKDGQVLSCQMYLPMPTHGSTTADFFNPLVRHLEDLMINRRANYPIERTLLTSGMVIAGVDSLHQGQQPVETPEMAIAYQPSRESTFRRD